MIIPRIIICEEMLCSFLPHHSKSIDHFFIPARGFYWEMGGDYGVHWINGSEFQGQIPVLGSTGRHSPLGCREEEDWSLGRRLPSHPDPVLSERRSGSLMDAPSWASGCESAATGLREGKERARMNMVSHFEQFRGCNIDV